MDAFARSSATSLPVKAAINAARVQQMAADALAHFPELKIYGPNLFTYGQLKVKLKDASDDAREFLRQAHELGGNASR